MEAVELDFLSSSGAEGVDDDGLSTSMLQKLLLFALLMGCELCPAIADVLSSYWL